MPDSCQIAKPLVINTRTVLESFEVIQCLCREEFIRVRRSCRCHCEPKDWIPVSAAMTGRVLGSMRPVLNLQGHSGIGISLTAHWYESASRQAVSIWIGF